MTQRRFLILLGITVAALLAGLYVRSFLEARRYLAMARDDSRAETDRIRAYRDAVKWHSPANPYSAAACEELFELIDAKPKDDPASLEGLWLLRSGLWHSRSFMMHLPGTLHHEWMPRIERAIAERADPEKQPVREVVREHPNFVIQILAQLFFWSWIGASCAAIWKGLSKSGRLVIEPFLGWGLTALAAFVLWLLALNAE